MPPYQKPANEIAAAWEKTNKKGQPFLSVRLDCTHSPETALALANMLLSGQVITFMASVNSRHDGSPDSKVPKYSMYINQQQHAWMVANYNRVYEMASAPQYDYRIHGNQPMQPQYTQPAAPAQPAYAPPPPAPAAAVATPVAPQAQTSAPPPPPVVPASAPAVPANPFGA